MTIDIGASLAGSEPVCHIFGAGSFYGLVRRPGEGDLIIAADGGMRALEQLSLRPDIVLGDFDSGDAGRAEGLAEASGAELVRLNVIKDVSDSAAAMELGKERGYRTFFLYGCTGGRLDHTLGNLQDVAALSMEGIRAFLFDDHAAVTAVTDGGLSFPEYMKGYLSVFPHTDISLGVCETGLKYELKDAELKSTFPLGLSNEFIGRKAEISVRKGTLLVYFQLGEAYEG